MAFIGIKRVLLRAKLRKVHKHYKSDPIQGERCYIQREGKATIQLEKTNCVYLEFEATAYANQNTMGVWLCRIMWRKVWDKAVQMELGRLMWGYEF